MWNEVLLQNVDDPVHLYDFVAFRLWMKTFTNILFDAQSALSRQRFQLVQRLGDPLFGSPTGLPELVKKRILERHNDDITGTNVHLIKNKRQKNTIPDCVVHRLDLNFPNRIPHDKKNKKIAQLRPKAFYVLKSHHCITRNKAGTHKKMNKLDSKIIKKDAFMNRYSAKRSFSNITSSVSLLQEGKRKKTLCKRGIGDVTVDSASKSLGNKRQKFHINRSLKRPHKKYSSLRIRRNRRLYLRHIQPGQLQVRRSRKRFLLERIEENIGKRIKINLHL
jgi:hypothetical protein